MNRRKSWKPAVFATLTLLVVSCFPGVGSAEHSIDPLAERVLRDSCNFLKETPEFILQADISYDDIDPSGRNVQYGATYEAAVRRPDHLKATYEGDLDEQNIWYDGRQLTLESTDEKLFASTKAPSHLDDMLDLTVEKLGFTVPVSDFLYSDPFSFLLQNVQSGYHAGVHKVDGVDCDHLVLSQEDIDWQIWIDQGDNPLPRKLTITYKNLPGSPKYTVTFSKWDVSPTLSDSLFIFEAPEGAERIEFLPSEKEEEK